MQQSMQQYPAPILVPNPTPSDYRYFKRQIDNFFLIIQPTVDAKLPLLLNALGRDGLAIYDGLPDPKDTFPDAVKMLDAYFGAGESILLFRKTFFQARQSADESATEFACRLRRLSVQCNFANATEMLRDVFVLGIHDDRLGERLLTEDAQTLTFDKALAKAEAFERASSDRSKVGHHEQPSIKWVSKQHSNKCTVSVPNVKASDRTSDKVTCYCCGMRGHKAGNELCKARNAECRQCGKRGHFAVVCRSKTRRQQVGDKNEHERVVVGSTACVTQDGKLQENNSDSDGDFILFGVSSCSFNCDCVSVFLNNTKVHCIPDTGASVSVIPSKLCAWEYTPGQQSLRLYGGQKLLVLGNVILNVKYGNVSFEEKFLVTEADEKHPLLSKSLCIRLGILQEIDEQKNQVCKVDELRNERIMSQFKHFFHGLGCIKGVKYKLRVKANAVPCCFPSRRLPPALLKPVEEQIDGMLKEGVIEPVDEAQWSAPMVPVRKKNGKLRICVDYRYLNTVLEKEPFQIPSLEELLSKLAGAKVFSLIDAKSGYHQIQIHKESRKFLSFSSPFGTFTYTRMPFGIASGPEIFQKVMHYLLRDCGGTLVYLDDVLVFGGDREEHDSRLFKVLNTLDQNGVKLNKDKCVFGSKKIEFLGHQLSEDGLMPSSEKLNALAEFPKPSNHRELRGFLGLAGFAGRRFVKNFAELSEPLWQVVNAKEFQWPERADIAFQKFKDSLAKISCLKFFDPSAPVVIRTDASGVGLGGVLVQQEQPVMFTSRKLSDTEKRYSQIEREFLAIVYSLHRFKPFILGSCITVETDNKPLVSFF